MPESPRRLSLGQATVLFALLLVTVAGSAQSKANDALLAKANKLYYSTKQAGLEGFDCAVHPDWRTLFQSISRGSTVAPDDPKIALLSSVKITLHGRMKGGSGLDWNAPSHPDKPLDDASKALLDRMQGGVSQTMQGFMQFWIPFVDGSAIPDSAAGLTIVTTEDGGTKMQANQQGASVTEVLDRNLILRNFDVVLNGMSVRFEPTFKPTDKGLLVTNFLAHIQPAGTPTDQAQEMRAQVEYQTVDGLLIPAKLNMTVSGTAEMDFALDGCTVMRLAK